MSYMSDAVRGVCNALGRSFGGYDSNRAVRTHVVAPMDNVTIVDFSITATGVEVYGSVSIVLGVVDWSGICFVSNFSTSSKRWLRRGPIRIDTSEFVSELVSACSDDGRFDLVVPPTESTTYGFHFDLAVA